MIHTAATNATAMLAASMYRMLVAVVVETRLWRGVNRMPGKHPRDQNALLALCDSEEHDT
jgi:hypothetical protein